MWTGVRSDDHGGLEEGGISAVEIADGSAGFREDEARGGVVPGQQVHFEVQFREAGCHQAQFDGGGAGAADVAAVPVDVADDVAADRGPLLVVGGQGSEEESPFIGPGRYMDGLSVAVCATALFRRVHLIPPGAVNDAHRQFATAHERHADAAVLVAAGVVGRPVDRVDDPHVVMGRIGKILLLAQESAPWKQRSKPPGEEMLDRKVGRRDQILPRPLVVDLEPAGPVHQRPGFPDDVDDLLQADFHTCLHSLVYVSSAG